MLEHRRKHTAMRISSKSIALGALLALALPAGAGRSAEFKSAVDAMQQGMSAYQGGYYEIAIPALTRAVESNLFMAQFTLARIYADSRTSFTDHAKAYVLYQKLANDHADVDPDDDQRAPYVAKALVALSGYLRRGLPDIGVRRDAERAAEYLQHAAIFLDDEDAQFELSKIMLEGDGIMKDVVKALHWLSVLSQKGHAPAQAFLADLYWRGQHVEKDPIRAYALISVAVRNAPQHERVWIEDTYQTIYCGAAEGVRRQATGVVAEWSQRYGRTPQVAAEPELDDLATNYVRLCADGRQIPLEELVAPRGSGEVTAHTREAEAAAGSSSDAKPGSGPQLFLRGGAEGGLREVGVALPQAPGR